MLIIQFLLIQRCHFRSNLAVASKTSVASVLAREYFIRPLAAKDI
jgi:hypothetical protein